MGLHQIKAELCSAWGGDKEVAHAAWASSYDLEKLEEKTDEDIKRIASGVVINVHDTPKERVWMEFFITGPIFVERQYDKYRMTVQYQDIQVTYLLAPMGRDHITQNELSGRYRTIPDRPYLLPQDVADILDRTKAHLYPDSEKDPPAEVWRQELERQHVLYQSALKTMRKAEQDGVISNAEYKRAREVLRGLLGTAYLTDMRVILNGNAFEHVINQRIDEHAQAESQVLAYRMLQGARKHQVASVMVETMVVKNGWQKHIDRIETLLAKEPHVSDV